MKFIELGGWFIAVALLSFNLGVAVGSVKTIRAAAAQKVQETEDRARRRLDADSK